MGVATVKPVRLQVAIGIYDYHHIGTTSKIAVTSLMKTSDEM